MSQAVRRSGGGIPTPYGTDEGYPDKTKGAVGPESEDWGSFTVGGAGHQEWSTHPSLFFCTGCGSSCNNPSISELEWCESCLDLGCLFSAVDCVQRETCSPSEAEPEPSEARTGNFESWKPTGPIFFRETFDDSDDSTAASEADLCTARTARAARRVRRRRRRKMCQDPKAQKSEPTKKEPILELDTFQDGLIEAKGRELGSALRLGKPISDLESSVVEWASSTEVLGEDSLAYQVAFCLMEELEAQGSSLPSVTLGKFMEGLGPPGTDPSKDKIVLVSANVTSWRDEHHKWFSSTGATYMAVQETHLDQQGVEEAKQKAHTLVWRARG